jgi:alanine racemase
VPSPAPSLPPPPARTWVEIDLAALRHNARAAQACLATPEPGILAVVKANGYGLGMVPVARALTSLVRAFAVANVAEACTLRDAGLLEPIYLLGPALPDEWAAIAAAGFCPAISNLSEVAGLAAAAQASGHPLAVHVVVDTGMGRIGAITVTNAADQLASGAGIRESKFFAGAAGGSGDITVTTMSGSGVIGSIFDASIQGVVFDPDQNLFTSTIGNITVATVSARQTCVGIEAPSVRWGQREISSR